MEHVIAKKVRLQRIQGKYVKDEKTATTIRNLRTTKDWVESQNEQHETSGIYYIIDEKASKKYQEDVEKAIQGRKNAKFAEENKFATQLGTTIAEALKTKKE